MKVFSFKNIFILLILVLLGIAVYNTFFESNEDNIISGAIEINNKNTVKSTDVRIGIIEFDNMNPILSNNKNVHDISRLIFDPLFTITQDYKVKGVLAKECSRIDEKTYIIKLKENIKWQDGNKFDSSDVIFTIDMLKRIGTSSVYYYNVKDIMLLEQIDENTIKIELANEVPFYQYNLTFPIISSKYFNEENFWQENVNLKPVGTGLFYISEVTNESILLKKNLKHEDNKRLKLDSVTLKLYNSLLKTINAFEDGEIDIFTTSNKNIEEHLGKSLYSKNEYINRDYCYISLNCENNILANKEVRQAINSAINKESLMKDVYNSKYKISNFPLDFGSFAYDNNNTVMAYDQNTSKRLLVENGWQYSSKRWSKIIDNRYLKIELNLLVNKSSSSMVKVGKDIKKQLEKVGIIINIKEASKSQYNKDIMDKNYDLIILENNYGYSPSLEKFFGEVNLSNYDNEEIKIILDDVKYIVDDNQLKQKCSRIVEIYNEDVPYISLFFNTNSMIYSNSLKGIITPNSYNLFYGIDTWYREYQKK